MSEKTPGLLDEVKRWLEFEDEPEAEGPVDVSRLQDELAMETDPEKREVLKAQIKKAELANEIADKPQNLLGSY